MSVFNLSYQMVEWVLRNLKILLSGNWPDSDGMIDQIKGKKSIPHAYFEDPILLATEVGERLRLTGFDGYMVEDKYIRGWSEEEIARRRNIWDKRVYNGIHRALLYMSGTNRKTQSYREWLTENRNTRAVRND